RFEFVKKRTLRRGTPPPRQGFWTSFLHADDPAPAPSPATKFLHLFYMQMSCTIVNDATSGGGKVLSVARLEMAYCNVTARLRTGANLGSPLLGGAKPLDKT